MRCRSHGVEDATYACAGVRVHRSLPHRSRLGSPSLWPTIGTRAASLPRRVTRDHKLYRRGGSPTATRLANSYTRPYNADVQHRPDALAVLDCITRAVATTTPVSDTPGPVRAPGRRRLTAVARPEVPRVRRTTGLG